MNKTQLEAIEQVIVKLGPNSPGLSREDQAKLDQVRRWLDSWVISQLQMVVDIEKMSSLDRRREMYTLKNRVALNRHQHKCARDRMEDHNVSHPGEHEGSSENSQNT